MTMCEDCKHLHSTKGRARYWMCMKYPRVETDNFVSSKERLTEPYFYCRNLNHGACADFVKDEK